jgi:hypothetical protein
MLYNINWGNYWLVLTISVIAYYSSIIAIYFKDELKQIFRPIPQHAVRASRSASATESLEPAEKYEMGDTPPWEEIEQGPNKMDAITPTELFLNEIEGFFNSVENTITSQELASSLRAIINKYPSLNDIHLKKSFVRVLGFNCDKKCSIQFTEEELMALWGD